MMENEKAEIARLAEKYGRVQSLMQYVNKKTLEESCVAFCGAWGADCSDNNADSGHDN